MAWEKIPVTEFTEAKVSGTGIYDVLMQANDAHLAEEYSKNRIKGPEYAEVYLGMMQGTMNTALAFLVQSNKLALEAELMKVQILIAESQLAQAEIALQIAQLQLQKVPAEIALLTAQAAKVEQETKNLTAEATLIPKQLIKLGAETDLINGQTDLLPKQGLKIDADIAMTNQQKDNAVIEGTVLTAQKCKLDAEYDLLIGNKLKVVAETGLLNQKVITEQAQTSGAAIDPNSVVGKQVSLYAAQTEGFARDAEQKAAKIMIDTWNVRRTTDEGTDANASNQLQDPTIGRAVGKMLTGVGA